MAAKEIRYAGFYWDDRDGKRVGIHFTYKIKDGKMYDEIETKKS